MSGGTVRQSRNELDVSARGDPHNLFPIFADMLRYSGQVVVEIPGALVEDRAERALGGK